MSNSHSHSYNAVSLKQLFVFLEVTARAGRVPFIWGAAGIGKTEAVKEFARRLGMDCIVVLGSQIAPEDLLGLPQIVNGKTYYCPPSLLLRDKPFVLFLDELNASPPDVLKAMFNLILNKQFGEYFLPDGSIVVAAGNRSKDNMLVATLPEPLTNRLAHVTFEPDYEGWLEWADSAGIHSLVLEFLRQRGAGGKEHFYVLSADKDKPFTTPRAWHMLSDMLYALQDMKLSKADYLMYLPILAASVLDTQTAQKWGAWAKNYAHSLPSPSAVLDNPSLFPLGQPDVETDMLSAIASYTTSVVSEHAQKDMMASVNMILKSFQAFAIHLATLPSDSASELLATLKGAVISQNNELPKQCRQKVAPIWDKLWQEVNACLSAR